MVRQSREVTCANASINTASRVQSPEKMIKRERSNRAKYQSSESKNEDQKV